MKLNFLWKPVQVGRSRIPYLVLAIALVLTGLATSYLVTTTQAKDRLRFQNAVNRTQNTIENRLDTYIALLQATSGLFAATNERVSREQFLTFVDRLRLKDRYRGIQGIGFSMRVRPEEKGVLVAQIKSNISQNFTIKPDFQRNEYHSIVYLEPLDRRNQAAIGYDMFTEPVRRAAMERARDTGDAAASGKVTLVQEIDQHKQAGFLIYIPIYRNASIPKTVAERRAALVGFVYSPFRADDLMQGIFGQEPHPFVDVEIFDGVEMTPEHLLHSGHSRSNHQPSHKVNRTIFVAGHPWTLVFTSRPEFDQTSGRGLVRYIVFAGTGISFVLFGVMLFLVRARDTAEQAVLERGESEERFRKLTEKVRVIPWEADALTWNFTYVGPQTEEILGYPSQNWYVENFWIEHIYPEDREQAIKFCQDNAAVLDNYEFEYRMIAADGRVVWLYDIVNVVRSYGKPKLLRGFMIDISDRKLAEVEREQLLKREQTARVEAEAANNMKDEFLATLSHELRTPLNAIVGWTQLLRKREFEVTTTTRGLETIDRNTKTLVQLVEDILDVSRIITGKLRLDVRQVELVSIIDAAIETVLPAARAKSIDLQFLIFNQEVDREKIQAQQKILVLGDSTRLQQIVWNLLSNAIKFTPHKGRVEVRLSIEEYGVQDVESREKAPHTPVAVIEVKDTGNGISPDFLPHVFDRFRQADSSRTRSHGGLGLGLAIVRHLVELHGATVAVKSLGIGQGATFIVKLPVRKIANG
ncbi:MAG: CHASE domain-containing protein [Scytonema sp. PMC 1069.18]|nr:CHASE domain-containing protein [Scytonema sp. PMC 1069.18]MEC4886945.1 CHASE domain-containing protein [Scytonema sp. PMC 1070.18]